MIHFYSWKDCPKKYKIVPYRTSKFFKDKEVTLVAIIPLATDSDSTLVKEILSKLTQYDEWEVIKDTKLLYWTKNKESKVPNKIIQVPLSDIDKVCHVCGEVKKDVMTRSYLTKDFQGSCGDSFCWASCELTSCKGRVSIRACEDCEHNHK